MSKPKKRTKAYSGSDAKTETTVKRYKAVERNKVSQWWHDHKRVAKPVAVYGGGAVVVIVLIVEAIRAIF